MKKLHAIGLVALAIAGCNGCHPTPHPTPVPSVADSDAPPASDAVAPEASTDASVDASGPTPADACANLQKLGCKEGSDPHCVNRLQKAVSLKLTDFNIPCITSAPNLTALNACGKAAVCTK
jgi:hypothetical protein